jgi:hypothetical protein
MTTLRLLAFSALIFATTAAAAHADYRCKVERIHTAQGEGPASLVHGERKAWIGKEFSVNRRTGAMSGPLRNNYATEPTVIDPGSQENSFKAISTLRPNELGPGSAVYALVINEYVDGSKKPFAFMSSDVVYFGTCWHDK